MLRKTVSGLSEAGAILVTAAGNQGCDVDGNDLCAEQGYPGK